VLCLLCVLCVFLQDTEFTVQDGKLFMLQTRNGKRTGPAALKIAIDLEAEVRRQF
jgi:pyruvate,orthophosphate dikinase